MFDWMPLERIEMPPGKALAHPLRVRILTACNEGEVTTKEFADREKVTASNAYYHFRILLDAGYLWISRREKAGGFERHFYRATRHAVIGDGEFAEMSPRERRGASWATISDLFDRFQTSFAAHVFDERDDSHLTWCAFELDEQGWRDSMSVLASAFDRGREIQAEAKARLKKSGDEPIPTTFALAGFESPAG